MKSLINLLRNEIINYENISFSKIRKEDIYTLLQFHAYKKMNKDIQMYPEVKNSLKKFELRARSILYVFILSNIVFCTYFTIVQITSE